MRKIILATALSLGLMSTAAHAETANWDGFYSGAFVGFLESKLLTDPGHASTTKILKDDGAMAGLVAGYRK